jgi:hypothetical protein
LTIWPGSAYRWFFFRRRAPGSGRPGGPCQVRGAERDEGRDFHQRHADYSEKARELKDVGLSYVGVSLDGLKL